MHKAGSAKANTEMILGGNMTKALLYLAVPIMINNLIQTMYNLTDTYWLGKLQTTRMAAISLVSPMQNVIINFGQGITMAGAILISQYVGARDKDNAKAMANHIFVCSIIFSVICGLLCFFFTPDIVGWLGAEGDVYTLGITYIRIVICDLPFLFMINIYSAVSQAQGDTFRPMQLNMLGIIINMILDPLFIMGFKWDIAGAAFATFLAKVPCAAIAFYAVTKGKNEIKINLKGFRFSMNMFKNIISVGLPTALGNSTMQLGFLLMTKNVLMYGDAAMAAYGIGNRINGMITMPANALGGAVSTIVGQNIGARQLDRAVDSYRKGRLMSVIFLFVLGMILSMFLSRHIVGIFTHDKSVVLMASDFLSIMAFWCFTNGVYNTTTGLFNGAGNTIVTMIVEATRLWIWRFFTLYIFRTYFHMGVESVWYCVVASNGISAFIIYILYKAGLWRMRIGRFVNAHN